MNRAAPTTSREQPAAAPLAQQPTPNSVGPQNGAQAVTGFHLLALDLASATGWAVMTDTQTLLESGVWKLRDSETPLPDALTDLNARLTALHDIHKFDVIAVEAISPVMAKHTATARILFGLSIQVERWAFERGINFLQPVSVQTIKKHAANLLGHDKAVKGKEQTLAAAKHLAGRHIHTSDEADAVVLAHWASLNAKEIRP